MYTLLYSMYIIHRARGPGMYIAVVYIYTPAVYIFDII